MRRYLAPIALILVSLAAFPFVTDAWDSVVAFIVAALGYSAGSCWLLMLLRTPGATPAWRRVRTALRLLIVAPTLALFAMFIWDSVVNHNEFSPGGMVVAGLFGLPIWIAGFWPLERRPAVATGEE